MHKYNAHAATDITGFGLLGHAQALARNQKAEVCSLFFHFLIITENYNWFQVGFVIHNLPVIAKMAAVGKACGNMFQLAQVHIILAYIGGHRNQADANIVQLLLISFFHRVTLPRPQGASSSACQGIAQLKKKGTPNDLPHQIRIV